MVAIGLMKLLVLAGRSRVQVAGRNYAVVVVAAAVAAAVVVMVLAGGQRVLLLCCVYLSALGTTWSQIPGTVSPTSPTLLFV